MLNIITGMGVIPAILMVGSISVAWTWMGGINTVIWTDVIQFGVMVLGGLAVTSYLLTSTPGGLGRIIEVGNRLGGFRVFELKPSVALPFTIYAGIIGTFFQGLASHGTDQMLAQRLLCCRDEASARKAIIASSVAVLLTVMMLGVGSGLKAYFHHFAIAGGDFDLIMERIDYILPIFVLRELPMGLKGLFFAAIFAAAASTGTSVLSAMGQSALATFTRNSKGLSESQKIGLSRRWILVCGVVLCGAALLCSTVEKYGDILQLALAMSSYTYGPLLGMFLFALWRRGRDGQGLPWAVATSIMTVVGLAWNHHHWVVCVLCVGALVMVMAAGIRFAREPLLIMVMGVAGILVIAAATLFLEIKVAWPWYFPIGTGVTYGLAMVLGKKDLAEPEEPRLRLV